LFTSGKQEEIYMSNGLKKSSRPLTKFSVVMFYYFSILLVVGIAVNVIFYMRTERIIREKMESEIRQYSDNIISYFDGNAKSLSNAGYRLLDSGDIYNYHLFFEGLEGKGVVYVKAVMSLLNKFIAYNDYVINSYLYFVNSNTVITPSSFYTGDYFFSNVLVYSNLDNEELLNTINSTGYLKFYPIDNIIANNKISEDVFPLTVASGYPHKMLLIMDISANKLVDDLYKILPREGVQFTISDKSGRVFLSPHEEYSNSLKKIGMNKYGYGKVKINLDGKKQEFLYYNNSSPETGWIYTTFIHTKRYSHFFMQYRVYSLALIAFLLFTGIYIYMRFSKKVISPVKILGRVDEVNHENIDFPGKIDEFVSIYNKMGGMLSENIILKSKISTMIELEKRIVMEKLLEGKEVDNSFINNYFSMNYNDNKPVYIVLSLIYYCSSKEITYSEAQRNQHQIISSFNDLFHGDVICYLVETNINEYGVILTVYNLEQINLIPGIIEEYFTNALCNTPEVVVKCGISSTTNYLDNINKLYKESQIALKECKVLTQFDIVKFDEILDREQKSHKMIIKYIEIIGDYMSRGMWNELECSVYELVNNVYKQNDLAYKTLYFLFDKLYSIELYVELPQCCNERINSLKTELPHKEIYKLFHSEQYFCEMVLLYYKTIAFDIIMEIEDNNEIANKIENILVNRYHEDLYIDLISDELGMSSRHISRLYKKYYGVSIYERLAKIRIEKAKEILANTDISVEEVGCLVGINNKNSFGRFFKRMEGISPGKYRQLYGKQRV
jgi:two-component system response regulator YesN